MNIVIKKDKTTASRFVADQIIALLNKVPQATLGLPTGSTPKGVYQALIESYQKGKVSFSKAQSFNLDEYLTLEASHPQSYAYYMRKNLFDFVDFKANNTHIYNGDTRDGQKECAAYTNLIKAKGGIDFQLLGIGPNGHIGFNEPNDTFKRHSHVVTLSQKTRETNARFFKAKAEVPKQAMTMGIDEIFSSKEIYLLALGEEKASIMAKFLLNDDIDPHLPASILHLHPKLTVVMDEKAARSYQYHKK